MNAIPQNPKAQFYPTPPAIVERMVKKANFETAESFLEPSAGQGDIAEEILHGINRKRRYHGAGGVTIDCIELDPYLRQILQYNFSEERLSGQRRRYAELENISSRTYGQNAEMQHLRQEIDGLANLGNVHIIYDDFLSFHTHKHYDWIVMNPPFESGDLHLLHALEIQQEGGGIVCLLNAETIRNPCTNTRKLLLQKLESLEAEIEYIPDAFLHAERRTAVEVAMVTVSIPHPKHESAIFERLRQARQKTAESEKQADELTHTGYIDAAVEQFNFEVEGTLGLVREYEAMKPYILTRIGGKETSAILTLSLHGDRGNYAQTVNVNEYLRIVRLKYWRALFGNPQFTGMMTSNIREEYAGMVDRINIYAAQQKAWLPPNYGRVKYEDMQPEEQAVVDSFQGKEAYAEVMSHADYFLADIAGPALLTAAV